jgi:hypothetical protein
MCTIRSYGGIGLACLLVSVASFVAHAVPLKLSLQEMVKVSDVIVIGKAMEISPASESVSKAAGTRQKIVLEVTQTLKGASKKRIEVHLSTEWSFEPTLRLGVTYLLFLQKNGPEMHVVQGYAGRVVLDGQKAKGIFMDGEPDTQDTAKFMRRIKSYQQ